MGQVQLQGTFPEEPQKLAQAAPVFQPLQHPQTYQHSTQRQGDVGKADPYGAQADAPAQGVVEQDPQQSQQRQMGCYGLVLLYGLTQSAAQDENCAAGQGNLAVLVEPAAAVVQAQTAKEHRAAEQRGSRPPVAGEEKFCNQGIEQVKNRDGGDIPGGDDALNGQAQLGHIQKEAALVEPEIPPDPVGQGEEHIGHQQPHEPPGVEIGQGWLF